MSQQVAYKENARTQPSRAVKRSRLPVRVTRLPLKDMDHNMETPHSSPLPHSSVRGVPNFKQLHEQWDKKLLKAKMERRVVYSTCSKLYKPPLTMKGPSSTTTKDREEIMDTILNQMAISTSNTIRQLSMIETQDCAPLKINLDQQFTETLSPTIIPVLTNSANKQSVRAVYNFYEPEPELCEVWKTRAAFRGTSVHVASGRRNPVAHTLDSMYFIPISNATHKL